MLDESAKNSVIVRPVEVLHGAAKIAKRLGVRESDVRKMERQGAPIRRRGTGRIMVCEAAEIWEWWWCHLSGA